MIRCPQCGELVDRLDPGLVARYRGTNVRIWHLDCGALVLREHAKAPETPSLFRAQLVEVLERIDAKVRAMPVGELVVAAGEYVEKNAG